MPDTTRAIVQRSYGPPERVLALRDDVGLPELAPDQVRVRVRAASVNAGDWYRVRGTPWIVRTNRGLLKPKDPSVGVDVAGVVEAVGSEVSHLTIGDAVFGMVSPGSGAFAEVAVARWVARKPERLSFEQAAALPVAGVTAVEAVVERAKVRAGQRVLVIGAGGGVGSFAVQVAVASGASVTAATRPDNEEFVRSLGADEVIDHAHVRDAGRRARFDAIVDASGHLPVATVLGALARGGIVVLVGAGNGAGGPLSRLAGAAIRRRLGQPVSLFIAKPPFTERLETLRSLADDGRVVPPVDRVYRLEETAAAIRQIERGRVRGKLVIRT